MRNTQTIQAKIKSLPNSPGVYRFFNQNQELIYIGKAANLKRRVSSYFAINKNGWSRPIEQLANKIADLKIKKTDTVLEAYFLEQSLIKKYQPKYNILGKDDKSTSFLVITKEKFPRFLIKRQTDLDQDVFSFHPAKKIEGELVRCQSPNRKHLNDSNFH